MASTTITDNPLIHNLYRLPGPVLTAYLNAPSLTGPGVGTADLHLRLRNLLDELHDCGATPDALVALGSVLETLQPGRPPAAAFVGADGQTRMFALPGADVADQAHCAAVPHILPLLHWRQQHPAFATVMLDGDGAELAVTYAGAARPLRAEVTGPDEADAVADALMAADADLLIIGGDARAEQQFLDQLPARVHADVTIKTIPDQREIDAAVQEYVDEESLRTLARMQDRWGPGVQGPAATMHALARAEVEVLVIGAAEAGTAWFGPQATGALAPDESAHHGPLDEVLARAAVLTDADIRILPAELADAPLDGVGALRRPAGH